MHYYLYEIRNNLNGKIYVGVHKTANLDDGYMGSGKVIKSAIEKHGVDNFTKVILETFDTSEAMYAREAEIVTDEFLARDDVYNLRRGGHGGFEYINRVGLNTSWCDPESRSTLIGESVSRKWQQGSYDSVDYASYMSPAFKIAARSSFSGKRHTPHAKAAISASNKITSAGSRNSQYGSCWIYHELIGNKKCKFNDLPLYIDQGWIKGRFLRS